MSFKPILEFHNRTIDKLVTRIEQQQDLLSMVCEVLPEELAKNVSCCVIHNTTLLVYTNTAVWASKLRFYQAAILKVITPVIEKPVTRIQIRLIKPSNF